MLIHPTRDDPEEHLSVETSTGLLIPKTDRGSVTLEVFGLNLRDRLVEERLKACDQVAQLLFRARVLGRESAKRKLRDIEAGRHPYSLAQRAALARG